MTSMTYQNKDVKSLKHEIFDYDLDLRDIKNLKGFSYTASFKNMISNLMDRTDFSQFTEFEKSLLFKVVSYNKMKLLALKGKYKFEFKEDTKVHGVLDEFTKYYDYTVSLRDFKMIYKVYYYKILSELNVEYCVSNFIDKEFCDNYYQLEDEDMQIQTTNYYGLYKHILSKGIIEVIDKGDYIMFFKKNSKKFHLERTEDNDIEWRDFDKAFQKIYEIYYNSK